VKAEHVCELMYKEVSQAKSFSTTLIGSFPRLLYFLPRFGRYMIYLNYHKFDEKLITKKIRKLDKLLAISN